MARNSADADDLADLLAEATGEDPEEIKANAEEFFIENPEDAEWEYIE